MRIVHVTTAHPPFDSRIFFRECRSAARLGEAVLIASAPGMAERDGVRLVSVPKESTRLRRLVRSVPRALRLALRERPAIFHLHDPELLPVGIILRLTGQPVVFDVHEYFSEIAWETLPPKWRRIGKDVVALLTERLPPVVFSRLVYVTEALRTEAGVALERSVVVRNLPSLRELPDVSETRQPEFDVVFLGTVSPFRMKVMVEIAALLLGDRPELSWLFIGIPDRTRRWTEETYRGEEILGHLDMRGRIDYPSVINLLTSCRLGFNYHPRQRRFDVALPVKVLEYMAVGLPVVTSYFAELGALLTPHELLMVEDQSPAAHAHAVAQLLADEHLARVIGEAGRRAVFERVNWESSEEPMLLNLYRELGRDS